RCTSALPGIVPHVDRASLETAGYDLRSPGRLGSKNALIAVQAEGHHANLSGIRSSMHRRNQRPDDQNKSNKRRAEPPDPESGGHRKPRVEITAIASPCRPDIEHVAVLRAHILDPACAGGLIGTGVLTMDRDQRRLDVGLHPAAVAADEDDRALLDQPPDPVLLGGNEVLHIGLGALSAG